MDEPIKLSEAIRQGAQLHPQGYGKYVTQRKEVLSTCALGAAIEAITGEIGTNGGQNERLIRQILAEREIDYHDPLCDPFTLENRPFIQCIASMNDERKMSREKIADWLEGQGY